ncbi:hypothetical protein L6164_027344 [Bauhinia variegata]|uniref:Uncharacterized protein n=1 Tax=Bauhinia variegata TaxID=167791 RepID=A0ACB9LUA4_BAUVA|nr:hypothetical protein L6164_027344 [Bauhinia variegata]
MQEPSSSCDHKHYNHYRPGTFKRSHRPKRPVLKVLAGQIAFRLICHSSSISGLIGNSGFIVSQLRRETACRIHCEDSVPCTDDRVVIVIGSVSPLKSITLASIAGEYDADEAVQVSSAQEAVLRVFERVWGLEAQKGDSKALNDEVCCKLLAHTSQIGAVVGKGGKNITTMRNYSGAKIRITPAPHCAANYEELILITGGILAVKKALIAVSGCLQDCPPLDKAPLPLTSPLDKAPVPLTLPLDKAPIPLTSPTVSTPDKSSPDLDDEVFPNLKSWLLPMQGKLLNVASQGTTHSSGASHYRNGTEHEVVFRLLCSNTVAGSVIGKKGVIVRALESKTGASIIFAAPLSEFGERIVTISAVENLGSCYSPAQDAVVLVFARIIEDHIQKGLLSISSMESPVTVRLLLTASLAGCLGGNTGEVISEMREVTSADIQILHGDRVPSGAMDDDAVLQITGEFRCVQNALYKVTGRIRESLLPNEMIGEARKNSNKKVSGKPLKGNLSSQSISAFPSARFLPQKARGQGRAVSENGKKYKDLSENLEFERGNKLATVTNTTVEIVISEYILGSVYGEDGGNLEQIRQISGAKVEACDPCVGTNGGRVVISGTPDQTFAAQSLLQAFILAAQRTPED